MHIKTEGQYAELRARADRYTAWARQFVQSNGWTVIPPGQKPPEDAVIGNDERSAIEVWEFVRDKPDRYFAYVKGPALTTWTGDLLGTITYGRTWRDNFGGTRKAITVRAINGAVYHGTYFASSGDYARIRKAKGKAL